MVCQEELQEFTIGSKTKQTREYNQSIPRHSNGLDHQQWKLVANDYIYIYIRRDPLTPGVSLHWLLRLITRYRHYIFSIQPLNSKISLSRSIPQIFIKIQNRLILFMNTSIKRTKNFLWSWSTRWDLWIQRSDWRNIIEISNY
jgi:hypothetical protein